MLPFDREPMTPYGSISCRFLDIQCRKISRPWNPGQGSIKIIESGTIRYIGYGFLLLFYSKLVRKKLAIHCIWYVYAVIWRNKRITVFAIFDFRKAMTSKTGLGVRQSHWKGHHSIFNCTCHLSSLCSCMHCMIGGVRAPLNRLLWYGVL